MNNNEIKAETEAKQSDAAALLPSAPLVAKEWLQKNGYDVLDKVE